MVASSVSPGLSNTSRCRVMARCSVVPGQSYQLSSARPGLEIIDIGVATVPAHTDGAIIATVVAITSKYRHLAGAGPKKYTDCRIDRGDATTGRWRVYPLLTQIFWLAVSLSIHANRSSDSVVVVADQHRARNSIIVCNIVPALKGTLSPSPLLRIGSSVASLQPLKIFCRHHGR